MIRTQNDIKNETYQMFALLDEMNSYTEKMDELLEMFEIESFYNKIHIECLNLKKITFQMQKRINQEEHTV